MKHPVLKFLPVLALAATAAVSSVAAAKGGDGGVGIQRDGPRIERGERINWEPKCISREPSLVERAIRAVVDSPVRPAIKDGQPAVQFHTSFP